MRGLSRLESPKLIDALCFLCVSRAVAETARDDRDAYISAFSRDLEEWREGFPELDEVSRFMWEIDLDSVPELQPQANTKIQQLRESVAALIAKANAMFGLRRRINTYNEIHELGGPRQLGRKDTNQAPPATEVPNPPATAREKEPPDRLICSDTTPERETPSPTYPYQHCSTGNQCHICTRGLLPDRLCIHHISHHTGISKSVADPHVPNCTTRNNYQSDGRTIPASNEADNLRRDVFWHRIKLSIVAPFSPYAQ
ncbi:hypothetical protein F5B18DRAFT_655137 [Nemania serpens]|nr:hypothetical protein F5B18DRAFT_655137 [Nemania serpens]